MEFFNAKKLCKDYDYTYDHERRQDYYFNRLLYKLVTRFNYSGLPESLRPEFLEMQLLLNGTVGITKGEDGLTSYIGSYAGNLDGYGVGDEYVGATASESFDKKVDVDVVVGLNNKIRLGEAFYIERYARMLGMVDESLNIQLLASRDTPVVEVSDETEKQQYIEAQKKRARGETAVFVKRRSVADLNGNHPAPSNVLQPNNSGIVETLDNLNSFHDDLMKRFFVEMGVNISSKDKKAQLTVSEVDSYEDYSLINIVDALACREKMIEDINAMFNLNASVELADPYKGIVEDGLTDDLMGEENDVLNDGEEREDNGED